MGTALMSFGSQLALTPCFTLAVSGAHARTTSYSVSPPNILQGNIAGHDPFPLPIGQLHMLSFQSLLLEIFTYLWLLAPHSTCHPSEDGTGNPRSVEMSTWFWQGPRLTHQRTLMMVTV